MSFKLPAGFQLAALRGALVQGSLTCDLSDLSAEVLVLPLAYCWRSSAAPFLGPAHTVSAPQGDLDAVYEGIRTADPGCVLVVGTGGLERSVWGETTTRGALLRGVAGVVLDGACRDVPAVRASGLGVVGRGVSPKRAERTGLGEVGCPVRLHGVAVAPGDLVVSDENGTVVVPSARIAELTQAVTNPVQEVKDGPNR